MYTYDIIEETKKDYLLMILSNKELFPFVRDDYIIVRFRDRVIYRDKIVNFGINNISDVLGISITDSVYLYYFLDIARDNGASMKTYNKKKSLRL